MKMRAIVNTPNMKTTTKSNGGESNLHRATITDGPLKGQVVLANRTVINAKGEAKSSCAEDDEVTLHMSQLSAEESTTGKVVFFFEIEKDSVEFEKVEAASAEDIAALLAASDVEDQKA